VDYRAYFFPVKYVITQNAVTVLKKYTPYAGILMGQPDYAATETTNRITASGGQWTVERDGYGRCSGVAIGSSQIGLQVYINGQRVTGSYVYPVTQFDNVVIHPVSKGDVVLINVIGTMTSIGCYFIPPKAVPNLFVEGADLQTSSDIGKVNINPDDKTMTVNGEIGTGTNGIKYSINRPDLWANNVEINFGSGLYGFRKTGVASGNAQVNIGMLSVAIAGSAKLIAQGGFVTPENSNPSYITTFPVPDLAKGFIIQDNGYGINLIIAAITSGSRTDAPYDVWVTYRK
jgi:hypothetical protein